MKALEPKASQYDTLQAAQQTAEQRAEAQANAIRDQASQAMEKAVRVTVKTALNGVVDDPDALIDDLNLAKFVTDTGELDEDAITALKEKFSALGGTQRRTPAPDRSQASGANGATTQSPAQALGDILQRARARA